MSFILDALKKVEAQKRFGSEAAAGELARSSTARKQKGRELVAMGVIAIVSAVVTAGALVLFASRPEPAESRPVPPPSPPAAEAAPVAPEPEPEPEPRRNAVAPPEAPKAPVGQTAAVATTSAPVAPEPDEAAEPPPRPPEIRFVGRAVEEPPRELPPLLEVEPLPEPAPEPARTEVPQLVLQGTSVLNGRPVAVISDERVFEGDFIQGARVLRIDERSVELELDGRRFTLTL